MSKNIFPKWSPSDLVEKYHLIENEINRSKKSSNAIDEVDFKECDAYESWKKDVFQRREIY